MLWVGAFAACEVQAQPTVIHDYEFTTGVDSSLWCDMTGSTPWLAVAPASGFTSEIVIPLPFTFSIWNRDFNAVTAYVDGSILFSRQVMSSPTSWFPDQVNRLEPVTSGVFGYRCTQGMVWLNTKVLNPDSVGRRVAVIQLNADPGSATPLYWQVHLSEEDNSVTVVYGDDMGHAPVAADVGLMLDTNHVVVVNQTSHTASAQRMGATPVSWPGQYRFYRYTPTSMLCVTPTGLRIGQISPDGTSVRMLWHGCSLYPSYRVEYGQPGFAEGTGTTVVVHDSSLLIENLTPEENIEVRVYANCSNPVSGPDSSGISDYVSMVVYLERVEPAEIHGYVFTTGVSSDLWFDVPDSLDLWSGEYYHFPFPVFLYDRNYYRQYVCRFGSLFFNADNPWCYDCYFTNERLSPYYYGSGVYGIFGYYNPSGPFFVNVPMQIVCLNPDSVGHRIVVVKQNHPKPIISNSWQVQLREEDHSVTMVYGEYFYHENSPYVIGIQFDSNRYAVVNQDDHTVSDRFDGVSRYSWPGQYRYYRFVPLDTLCPQPVLSVRGVSLNSNKTRLIWESCPFHTSFSVEYGPAGFAEGSGTRVTTNDTTLLLEGLLPDVDYEARVTALCPYGNTGYANLVFRTPCNDPPGNQIYFANIYADSVKCSTGTVFSPSNSASPPDRVDYGCRSVVSRHTVHYDNSETEYDYYPRRHALPHPVPDGFCSSVRLGSWSLRATDEQESITYPLTVDTNQFDLIIVRFTAVSRVGYGTTLDHPAFSWEITDSLGNSLGDCYHGSYVADTAGLSIHYASIFRVWGDWRAVGLDLAPLHGQRVFLTLSNYGYDYYVSYSYLPCYSYFTLQSATKRIRAESCGDGTSGTFHAPKGFVYRWYSMADTAVTLSTADSLYVTAPGEYGCHVTSLLCPDSGGFYLRSFAGGRYPVAAFDVQPLDSCGSVVHFVNRSVIARDSARLLLTSSPCEDYRWVVDDSVFSTLDNPTFSLGEGVHTVRLYAMLANGACVDSAIRTYPVVFRHDTLEVAVCEGVSYFFFGQELTEAGDYVHVGDCRHTTLHLRVNPVYVTQAYDTFPTGEYYLFDGVRYRRPGVYTRVYSTVEGCDSTVTLHLSSIAVTDTAVCSSSLPVVWQGVSIDSEGSDTLRFACGEGTDSIVVLNVHVLQPPVPSLDPEFFCRMPGGYSVVLPDSLCFLWDSQPVDTALPAGWWRGGGEAAVLLLFPTDTTTYYLTAVLCDTVPCPWHDTLLLTPVAAVEARLGVSPPQLDEGNLDLTAVDLTTQSHARQWYVDSVLHPSQDSVIFYRVSSPCDSVRVMLVANTDVCTDTAYAAVPVKIQSLWFPNVFTPDAPTNNLFRGYGVKVKDYELRVYTRWGDCIFRTRNINEGWDGTYLGVRSPVSAYLYVCRYTTLDGNPRTVYGTVALLR